MSLTITGISKTYPNGVQALKNISLTIGNHMFGLLGPNGAGKSTLMRTIATLQEPDCGTIFLDGINVLKEKNAVRQTLGYLPQELGVYPKLSAIDMLSHPCRDERHYPGGGAQRDGRSAAAPDQPLGLSQEGAQHLFRRDEAALWHRAGNRERNRRPLHYASPD
jgi:ABC-type sugar transport system ATPase subunit